jgi:tRNA-splicing ligase RtcB
MQAVVTSARVPIKLWAPLAEVESSALEQLINTANLPCVFRHIAAMPDVHLGYGATVGSVVACKGAVIPGAVGVDIGCGMMAVQLALMASDLPDSLKHLRAEIERSVPVGFVEHKTPTKESSAWPGWKEFTRRPSQLHNRFDKAQRQLGTLGGGNHFIELCLDQSQQVWVMLHSGSRNIGKEIAEVHMYQAKKLMQQYRVRLIDPDLAYLEECTAQFDAYWDDLQWAQTYAFMNRDLMMRRVLHSLGKVLRRTGETIVPLIEVNCHHNYAEREQHFGHQVIVTRKGAVRARQDDMGIIPGSMGARSYIVRGRGNPESYHSCSHGAGRRMSRGQAKRTFCVQDLHNQTAGVECRKDAGVLDEIPGAYKDIDQVMANQTDLVDVVAELKQILCVKG